MKINNNGKSALSVKRFILEFGEDFSEHIKKRLMELEERCFLTRKEVKYLFDLKHVEHLQYDCPIDLENKSKIEKKEYSYGQFAVINGILYFSENCFENDEIIQSPAVSTIYESLDGKGLIFDEGRNLKIIDDTNIDYVIDSISLSCPQVSREYLDIVKSMISHANSKR